MFGSNGSSGTHLVRFQALRKMSGVFVNGYAAMHGRNVGSTPAAPPKLLTLKNYTMNFPNYDVKIKDCTPEMCRTIVALAEKLKISIVRDTIKTPHSKRFPFMYWSNFHKCVAQADERDPAKDVTFSQFVSYMISDPEPEISERDKKLNESVEIIQQELDKIKNLKP